jgi:hypothetical protein
MYLACEICGLDGEQRLVNIAEAQEDAILPIPATLALPALLYCDGKAGVTTGIGEPLVFAARFNSANMSVSVESTKVDSLVKIL